jgi:hypothetical protein
VSRRRYVYREVAPGKVEAFEVGADHDDTPRSTGDLGKFAYDNLQATDGTDISSRTKRREYMKRHGITDYSDFAGAREQAAKEKENFLSGRADTKAIRETVERSFYERSKRNGR